LKTILGGAACFLPDIYREIKMYKTGISENQLKPVHILTTPELIRFFTGLEEKSF